MVCLGLEPGAAMMKAQRNPLSYDCIPFLLYFCLFKTVEEIKNCLWLYLNRGSLNSKATALPTVPHSIQRNFLLTGSVTRFGEFSPLWVTIIVLWPFWKCTFSIWQNFFWLILANFICYWADFNCCKWPNIEQTI